MNGDNMNFECEILTDDEEEKSKWSGQITDFKKQNSCYEFWIISRSSIMVIMGRTSRGAFICMPDFRVGCHLVALKDKFWNTEQLVEVLGKVDGTTVATALFKLADSIEF
ncbi:TPA: hypothetical protein DCQ85_04815 [Candidatus Magasanikbacteria bacterium]|nr:hypothetical protein [Candidatus Magasanikbacteria bacterium]